MNSFVWNLLPFLRISTPLSMDMFAWTRKEAVFYNGIIICCIGFESILVFLVVKVASQRYPHSCMSGLTKIVLSPLINVIKNRGISFQSWGSTCVACRLSHHILWLFYSTSMGKSLSKNTMGRWDLISSMCTYKHISLVTSKAGECTPEIHWMLNLGTFSKNVSIHCLMLWQQISKTTLY